MVSESAVLRECIANLAARGVFCVRVNSGAAQGRGERRYVRYYEARWADAAGRMSGPIHAGHPDLLLVIMGRAVYVEIKRPVGGRLSHAQREWLDAARRAGALGVVATSWAELEACLRAEGLMS
jgi:hypothetical protein